MQFEEKKNMVYAYIILIWLSFPLNSDSVCYYIIYVYNTDIQMHNDKINTA